MLNEKNVKTDIAVLHMGTNDILNAEADKGLIAESIMDIAKECFRFGVKANNTLQDKCVTYKFHFIDNSNIKKEHLWTDGLHLNRSGKDVLMNNFLRSLNKFFKEN